MKDSKTYPFSNVQPRESSIIVSSSSHSPPKVLLSMCYKDAIEPNNVHRNHKNRIENVTGPKVEGVKNSNKQTIKPKIFVCCSVAIKDLIKLYK
jgi:hypothetical protein